MYTELHLHTAYSFLDGASKPDEMITRARELGYSSLAITDHNGVYGAMEFSQLATEHDISPITGAEVTLSDDSHIILLAESTIGYGNLCRLLTHLHHEKPPAPVALGSDTPPASTTCLGDYAEGLILLTGCREGQLARLVDANRLADADIVLRQYIAWFGASSVFVELQQNFVFGDTPRIDHLVRLANQIGVRYVATGNVHYHRRNRHRLQDVMVAIHHTKTLDGCHRERRPNSEFYLRSPEEAERIFSQYPEAIRSTTIIAGRCRGYVLARDLSYTFPDYQTGTRETPHDYLTRICTEIFQTRYEPNDQIAFDRLKEELRLISHHDLSGFFLMYRDLLDMGRQVAAEIRGRDLGASRRVLPPGRGRGSSVSSIVCYLIGLSPVDPMAHDLYVGRFLNEELPSIPDIDIDFPREIREKMIERVYEEYGTDHAALVCTFATYRLRSAVRDIGKTLGIPLTDLDRIAKLSEPRSADHLAGELARLPEFAARIQVPPWSHLIDLASQLAGFPRHIGQHPGGMIISASPLNQLVPIQPAAMDGRFICQWDKDSCEDARFIKIDFLSLGMLSLVEECLDLVDDAYQSPIDLSKIDYNDPAVYSMIQEGDTIGVFQIESRAQIQMLRRTLPMCLNDLVVQVAIVRPGPIIGGAVTPYVRRKEDPNYQVTYDHPVLEPILKDTLGVMLYQEQVVQVAEAMAGFSAGQADQLRRAMTRKRSHESMESMREVFIQGAMTTHDGVERDLADGVFTKLAGFADYGFPKSHAAAFGLLAYQSCWLKYYYPAEFMCALLNNQPMGFYAPHVLINDAKRHGLRMLRPDVNLSDVECTVEDRKTVRIGLSFIKGLSTEIAQMIVAERMTNGAYRSLADLIRRVALRPDVAQNLISAEACGGFGLGRREMLWQLGLFIPAKGFGSLNPRKTRGKQLPLDLPTVQDHVELKPTTAWERMADEYRVMGLSPHWHPMALLRQSLPSSMVSSRNLETMREGTPIRLPGLIVCRQRPGTAKGITFLLLEDEFSLVNIVIYPDLYERQRLHVRSTPLLIVEGRVQLTNNNINVVAERLVPIEDVQLAYPYRPGATKEDPWVVEESANPQIIQLDHRRTPEVIDGPRTRADLMAISPEAHSYR
ncbi:MAG: DNA polymerase III subunit alpha [Thermomicrobiales bacterium]